MALVVSPVRAASFPDKPMRVVVPTAIGGPSDFYLRAVAEPMRVELGQHFVVENITGATGNIGLERVGSATPDGYTLSQASAGNTANLAARPKSAFDILSKLRPVGKVCPASFSLALGNEPGAGTPDELAAQIRTDIAGFRRIIEQRKLNIPE